MDTKADRGIFEWLARAQPEPAQVWRDWHAVGLAMLPLGRIFDAACLPEGLVHAAVGTADPQEVAARLAEVMHAPFIYDGRRMGGAYYALVEKRDRPAWRHHDVAPLMGRGTFLGVPKLSRREPPYWVVPPRFTGDLCTRQQIAGLVMLGRERLATEAEQ